VSNNDSDYHANAEIEALKRTLDCVRQITRDFENMAARRRLDNAELAVLSGELRQMGGNGALTVHPSLAAAFQEIEQSMARRKALAKELVQAASNFAQQLIKWAAALKERQSRQTLSAPAPAITGAADATLEAPPLTKPPPLESPNTPTEPGGAPEPGIPDVPNLGPATVAAAGAAAATAAAGAWALTFSEVLAKREENIIKYGNPYGPPSQYIHGSSTTGGASENQSDVQKGWILYDGERRDQDGTIYTRDGQIAVDANGNSRLSNEEREALAAVVPTNSATGDAPLKLNQYPKIIDPRIGKDIPFPSNVGQIIPQERRVPWGALERANFIAEWYRRGYPTPEGGWQKYDIHHILPREFGGGNDFWNLVPIDRQTHQRLFNNFWRSYNGP
jgi:hypothetical protein